MAGASGEGETGAAESAEVYRLDCEPLSYFFDFADIGREKLSNTVMLPEFVFGDGEPFDEYGYAAVYPVPASDANSDPATDDEESEPGTTDGGGPGSELVDDEESEPGAADDGGSRSEPSDEGGTASTTPGDVDPTIPEDVEPAIPGDVEPTVVPVRPLPTAELKPEFGEEPWEEMRRGERHLVGSIRTNMLQQIYGEEYRPELIVRPLSVPEIERVVYPEYADRTPTGYNCYLSAADVATAPFGIGDVVEVRREPNGGRLPLTVHELDPEWKLDRRIDEPVVGVDGYSRRILGIDREQIGSASVSIYPAVQVGRPSPGRGSWLLGKLVGAESARLRVASGVSQDEYKGIARVDPNTMASLGIDPGDMAVLEWNGRSTRVRCLEPPGDGAAGAGSNGAGAASPGRLEAPEWTPTAAGVSAEATDTDSDSLVVQLPHTVRDAVGVNVGDGVVLRRDLSYVLRKRIALSLFGIIGIFVGGLQVGLLFSPLSALELGLLAVALLVTAAFAVWLIFYPERQRTGPG